MINYGSFTRIKPMKSDVSDFVYMDYTDTNGKLVLRFGMPGKNDKQFMYMTFIEARFKILYEMYLSFTFVSWEIDNSKDYIKPPGTEGSPIYLVEGSDFLSDFHIETGNWFGEFQPYIMKHYHIFDTNYVIDVLSSNAPKIEIYDGEELKEKVESLCHSDIYNLDGTPKESNT